MRTRATLLVMVLVISPASVAVAQPGNSLAGWAGLISTPTGALPPLVTIPALGPPPADVLVRLRYGYWRLPDGESGTGEAFHNFGVGMSIASGSGRTSIDVGWTVVHNCPQCGGALMAGSETDIPLWAARESSRDASGFRALLNPALGVMKPTGEGSNGFEFSAAVSVPLLYVARASDHLRLVPFLSPGLGVGGLNANGTTQAGMRMMIGGGVTVGDPGSGIQLTASGRRVLIQGGSTMIGIGATLGR